MELKAPTPTTPSTSIHTLTARPTPPPTRSLAACPACLLQSPTRNGTDPTRLSKPVVSLPSRRALARPPHTHPHAPGRGRLGSDWAGVGFDGGGGWGGPPIRSTVDGIDRIAPDSEALGWVGRVDRSPDSRRPPRPSHHHHRNNARTRAATLGLEVDLPLLNPRLWGRTAQTTPVHRHWGVRTPLSDGRGRLEWGARSIGTTTCRTPVPSPP